MKNGQTDSREVEHAKGSPEVPMTGDERKEKFTRCARQALDEGLTRRALETIESLETLEDIGPLCRVLMA